MDSKFRQRNMLPVEAYTFKVSILMITYNHEKYVTQAVESVLSQEADFDYELVVGEDCSTDYTREILLEHQRLNPNKIHLLLGERKLGPQPNFIRTLEACRGQYIALLEGDDYWLTPTKLQTQVEFLDNHPEYSFCFTNAFSVDEGGREFLGEMVPTGQLKTSTLADLLKGNFIPNCTVMFRKGLIRPIPEWFLHVHYGDWALHVLNAQHGQIGYIDEVTSAYRKHAGGIYSGLEPAVEVQYCIADHEVISDYLNHKYERIVRKEQRSRWKMLSELLIDKGFQLGCELVDVRRVSQIFDTWPPELPLDSKWKGQVLGGIYERLLFQKHHDGDFLNARYCWLGIVRHNPVRLLNRGVISIVIDLLCGQKFANILRDSIDRVRS